jgi:hypothetical protein
MKHHNIFLFLVVALVSAAWSDPTASIFVKNAEEFATIRKDLEGLKVGLGSNAELDSLWEEAACQILNVVKERYRLQTRSVVSGIDLA